MYGMPTIQHPLCSRIEAIWCLASNQGLKKHTREPQRHGTVCAEYAIEALGGAASRLAQIEPLHDPTRGNVEGCCHIRLRSTLRQLFNHYRREPKLVFNGAREAQIAEIPANDRLVRRDSEVTT